MDGPMIDGDWYDPQTGDSFTVRDSFFQDGQLLVQATDGRMFDYNILQNYVKSDKPLPKQNNTKKPKKNPTPKPLPAEALEEPISEENEEGMLEEDLALINGNASAASSKTFTPAQSQTRVISDDERMIERILKKATSPEVTVDIKWSKFPEMQMSMLDMMDIDQNDIINYYINKLDIESIKSSLSQKIAEFIAGYGKEAVKPTTTRTRKTTKK